MNNVIMPRLGLTMQSGTVVEWYKNEGDEIKEGEELFQIMTDKVTQDVEAKFTGVIIKIVIPEGEEVPVGTIIAYIGERDEPVPETEQIKKAIVLDTAVNKEGKQSNTKKDVQENRGHERVKISPVARKLAEEKGIDYIKENIRGTGSGGRIQREDIISHIRSREKIEGEKGPSLIRVKSRTNLKGLRKIIAERMSLSAKTIPHIVLTSVANVTNLQEEKEKLNNTGGEYKKITYTDFLVKMYGMALNKYSRMNSSFQNNEIIIYDEINVGIAVALEDGLVVPVIRECEKLSLTEICAKRIELIEKAKTSSLVWDEINTGTATLTNLGMYGVRNFSPIINPPQASILAVGEIYAAPVLIGSNVENNLFIDLVLACDHRVVDGAESAQFLKYIVDLAGEPHVLL